VNALPADEGGFGEIVSDAEGNVWEEGVVVFEQGWFGETAE
jgi:hypothetical protein